MSTRTCLLFCAWALSYDQLDCGNLASIEQVVRRILEIQTIVRWNPRHPTSDALTITLAVVLMRLVGCMVLNSHVRGSNADLFPLPAPSWRSRRVRASSVLTGSNGAVEFGRRLVGRIGESVRSLNSLSGCSARSIRKGAFVFDGHQSDGRPTTAQSSVLRRLASNIHECGACPSGMNPKSCFEEVTKSRDIYSLSQCSVAPFNLDLLKVTKTDAVPEGCIAVAPTFAS